MQVEAPVSKAWEHLMLRVAVKDDQCVSSGCHECGLFPTGLALIPTGLALLPTGLALIPTGLTLIPTGLTLVPCWLVVKAQLSTIQLAVPVYSKQHSGS